MGDSRFAGRLRELRDAAGLTQQQLADKAGISKGGVADLEQGRREPAWNTVLALAGALGVDCTAFNQEPGETSPRGPGRPVKPKADVQEPAAKKPRGRPKKGK